MELQPRRLREDKVKKEAKKERDRVKAEQQSGSDEEEDSPEEEDEGEHKHAGLPEGLRQELLEFGDISTYEELGNS